MPPFKIVHQTDSKGCAPACLKMITQHYGKHVSLQQLRETCHVSRQGASMLGLADAAEKEGLSTLCAKITIDQLSEEITLPCILLWKRKHYVICYAVKGKKGKRKYYIADPAIGKHTVGKEELYRYWISGKHEGEDVGIAMQLCPSPDFQREKRPPTQEVGTLRSFLTYILPHKWKIAQLLLGTIIMMGLGYLLPFLSQQVVDVGIRFRDLHFIIIMMAIQLSISFFTTSIQFMQSWIALHMHTVINIQLIANYLSKLSKMPLHFFEQRTLGDILQRIGDHDRIKSFLMNDLISILFSTTTFLTFGTVLLMYNWKIFTLFICGSLCNVLWILAFMKYRREIDHKVFDLSSQLQNNLVQFVQAMPEIKLNNIERQKRWEWERIQARLYKISIRALRIGQVQEAGSILFATVTNIGISYISAQMVVSGELTLGTMVALTFVIGQVAAPIGAFIGFAQSYQDAKISLERLNDLYTQQDEDQIQPTQHIHKITGDILLDKVTFSYTGIEQDNVLHEISLHIPEGKTTAIVGASGCGKTTLIKLLQGFYTPQRGTISIGGIPLAQMPKSLWRSAIGAVMQEGYIFSDTIARNIAIGEEEINEEHLQKAAQIANIESFIEQLPMTYNTKIGDDGMGLSQGQKQRILMARCIYKNPSYIFLDEATNALDTKNEREILQQLQSFYGNRTMLIVAHRLSTIRKADNIVVITQGKIAHQGKHEHLMTCCPQYAELVRNQTDIIENE